MTVSQLIGTSGDVPACIERAEGGRVAVVLTSDHPRDVALLLTLLDVLRGGDVAVRLTQLIEQSARFEEGANPPAWHEAEAA